MGIMYKLMKHRNLTVDLSSTNVNNTNKSDRNRLIAMEGHNIETPERISDSEDCHSAGVSNMDKQFTAEHIIQLCKFLAEKSKRNKNLHKQQQSPKKLTKCKQNQFQFEPMMEHGDEDNDDGDFYQNEALPLLSKQRQQETEEQLKQRNHNNSDESEEDTEEYKATTAVLSTRLSPDINSLNISSNTATSCALQHHQQLQQQNFNYQQHHHQQQHYLQQQHSTHQQGKRDILLKIRKQIFERKRLRENGNYEPQAFNNATVWRPW